MNKKITFTIFFLLMAGFSSLQAHHSILQNTATVQTVATASENHTGQDAATTQPEKNLPAATDTAKQEKQSVIGNIITWYNSHLNYVSVTLLMTLESSFIPFPSEIVVPPAAYQACNPDNATLYVTHLPLLNILILLVFACFGALLGAIINYFLSKWLGRPFVYWFADSKLGHLLLLSGEKVKKAEDYFIEHGNISTFVGRLIPGIRQLISIPAGLSNMKFGPFIFYTALGATSWNIVLALIGYLAQGNKELIDKYSDELSHLIIILFIVAIAFIVIKSIRKKSKNQQKKQA